MTWQGTQPGNPAWSTTDRLTAPFNDVNPIQRAKSLTTSFLEIKAKLTKFQLLSTFNPQNTKSLSKSTLAQPHASVGPHQAPVADVLLRPIPAAPH
ncbi:hypothetical protein DSO57_1032215 [Entomophthora muscae]|uniref:Uncharacterized protein n=1 Tax=Entomophthora muscae TaxID=34485 RepID=A0ACC2TYQ4_9FUNG|nr:hypothetical protein DSO57_1032215 [Entomophthora muscae]